MTRGSVMAAGLTLTLALASCTSWYAHPNYLAQPLKLRDQVRICAKGECHQVHAVQVFGDSVTAVPYFQDPNCDSCTMHLALSEVDSVQTSGSDKDKNIFLAIVLVPVVAALIYVATAFPRD